MTTSEKNTSDKTDSSTKTSEELLRERMNGKLPVIDIIGHPFYVDMRMQSLRPHNDFSTSGIPFSAFDDHATSDHIARIPYNPKTHEAAVMDIDRIKAIPKDWIIVEIPQPWKLDPYGYARDHGFDIKQIVKEHPIQENLKARVVPWNETGIPEIIEQNKAKQELERKRLPKSPIRIIDGSGKSKSPKK